MKRLIIWLALLLPLLALGQQYSLNGNIIDEEGRPLPYATAVLLNPADSTLQFYGISNSEGNFGIRQIKQGDYLLQLAFMGYETFYKPLNIPASEGEELGSIMMKKRQMKLDGVDIVGERIPMKFKKDTIEFDAGAFKTRPDAVAEDLLRKLPGVEVDRAGNIKALGEEVHEVLVDGKEFFGDDPKVATKNLPADALDKVQVIDKKSDEAEFTGIDDGQRNKAVNLVLKDGKKNGIFGDVEAGYGTDDHYEGSFKAYRFSDKTQFAALGMLNNVNQFGFSFNDYLSFSGGLSSIMGGGGTITIGGDNSVPINFGQPVSGLTTSGAGGLNFSYSTDKHNRTFLSYLVSGLEKDLQDQTTTQNFTSEGIYKQQSTSSSLERNFTHSVNFGLRRRIDSVHNISFNARLGLTHGKNPGSQFSESFYADSIINSLKQSSEYKSHSLNARANGFWQYKFNRKKSVLKTSFQAIYSDAGTDRLMDNETKYFNPPSQEKNSQFQDDNTKKVNANGSLSLLQAISGKLVLVPGVSAGTENEDFKREYGIPLDPRQVIDSLSPDFSSTHQWLTPALKLRRTGELSTLSFGLGLQNGRTENYFLNENALKQDYLFLKPSFSWEYNYRTTRKINVYYTHSVQIPSVELLQPTGNYLNPLHIRFGNRNLKPQQTHSMAINWLIFDQFSSTSFFASLNGTYIRDKFNWERNIDAQLVQTIKPVNVEDDYTAEASFDYSTHIRKLGLKVNIRFNEKYNRGINIINAVENINTNLTHRLKLRFENRKKEKWDISVGASAEITHSRYSVQEDLDNNYYNYSCFADISFTPNDSWFFSASADISSYSAESFDDPLEIPLISAEIRRYMLKNKRLILSLRAFDLLDKNTNLVRMGEMNYLMEQKTNSIGRFVMFSLKYRLNKFGGNGSGLHVEFDKM